MEKNKNVNKDQKVDMKVGQIELPKIDVTKHIGKKATIEKADVYSGVFGYYLKIETKIVETIGTGDKKVELRGTRIFGLQQDSKGVTGYGKDTKLGIFMNKMSCNTPKDLIGKEVILQSQTSDSGTDFLTFN